MADKAYKSSVDAYSRDYSGPNHGTEGWSPDDPIMADMMNNIEAGIVEAIKLNNALETQLNGISAAATAAQNTANAASNQAQTAYNNVENYKNQILHGDQAWSAVKAFTNIINDDSSSVNNAMVAKNNLISSMDSILQAAAGTYTDPITHAKSLPARLDEMTRQLGLHDTGISGLTAEITAAKQTPEGTNPEGYHLVDNINAIKASIKTVSDEIEAAHRQTGDTLKDYFDTLKSRLDAIDITDDGANTIANRLAAVETEIGPLANSYIDQLKTEVSEAHRNNIEGGDTLKKRFEALGEDLGTTSGNLTTLKGRVDDIATEIDNANGEGTLSERLSGIDSAIADISGENGSIASIETRLDAIDTDEGNLVSRVSALETEIDMTSESSRIDLLSDEINEAHDGEQDTLAKRFKAIDDKIDELETGSGQDSSATIIVDDATFVNGLPVLPEGQSASKDVDYLIKNGDKYYYWKYINNKWELISGGGSNEGGTGTSSASIVAELPAAANADPNIDYYVGNNEDGYTHYRYVPSEQEGENGVFITILPKKLTDNLNNLLNYATVTQVTKTDNYTVNDAWPTQNTITGGPAIYAINDTEHTNNLLNDFVAVRNARVNVVYKPGSDQVDTQTLQILDTKGHLIEYPIVGGSGGAAYSIRFLSTLSNNIFTVPQDSTYRTLIKAKPIVKQGDTLLQGVSFSGEILYRLQSEAADVWHKSNIILPTIYNDQEFSVDVSSILANNTTTQVQISLIINTGDGNPVVRTVDYTITKTQISISSTFNPATILSSANLILHFTCMGVGLKKYVHALVDGVETVNSPKEVNTHNVEEEISIPLSGLKQGSHTLQLYFTTDGGVTSNKLNYYIIYSVSAESNTPIIGLNAQNSEIIYGEELAVNYTVYTPGKEKTEKVEIELYTKDNNDEWVLYNGHTDSRENVAVELSSWKTVTYPMPITPAENEPEQPIEVRVKVKAYNTISTVIEGNEEPEITVYTTEETTSVIINRFTNPNNYDFSEVAPNNLLFEYSAYGKSNNAIDRNDYQYTYIANDQASTPITFHGNFTGFNWATNGYQDDGSLLINGNAKYSINVPIFQQTYNGITLESTKAEDITEFGRTIEIDYEVRSATDLNATIIECKEPNATSGLVITPSYCYLTNRTTPAEIDERDNFIINESSIAAAYLQTNTRIHLVFVIEPWSREKAFDQTFHQSVNIYINGEFANSCPYERDSDGRIIDSFTSNGTLTLGSDTCILKVYNIRMYNRGLNHSQVLQLYKLSPNLLYDRLERFENNDILENGVVSYEKAKRRFNCLLLKGPDPTAQETLGYPTISPFKGSPSPAKRKKKATSTDYEGKTESGLIFTKPSSDPSTDGFVEEFNLCDKVPADAPAYLGQTGAYCSTNNVQGTTSQKYPLHNLKVYLAKWQKEKTTTTNVALEPGEEVPEGTETVEIDGITYKVITETTPAQIKKVKYSLKGYNTDGTPKGTEESTLCWKADYMSTDHANTYNANIADTLFTNPASEGWNPKWSEKHLQNTVYGVRCLLFQQQGDNATPVFVGDGCLNNDKGNTKTFGLEDDNDDGNDTLHQKWEFTNNTSPLDVFKSDNIFAINETDSKKNIYAKGAFECNYPDEGDLKDDGIEPDYNHLQLLLTWVNKRACYLDYSVYDEDTKQTTYYTISDEPGSGGTYNGVNYDTERELKKAIFKNEFEDHFIKSHVLTYYLFSEYVALCDNRAKNMFMRSDDIRSEVIYNANGQKILNGNQYPDDGTLWSTFVATSGENAGITHPDVINWSTQGENHSTFAKWVPVLYDLDSCFGVENVGLMTIKYNADWQYVYNNKKAFSGFDSIFWLMVEDTYADELSALATQLYNNELNFTNFYRQQITGNLNATCPAITNEDMILKYQQPWNEGFINYSEDPDPVSGEYPKQTPLYKYIQRGTRTTQKTTFMRQRSMLLSSKYVSTEFTNSMISFRAGTLVTGNDTLLQLVANQDLYPAIMFGDSNTLVRPSYRVIDNVPVQITDGNYYVSAGTPYQIVTSQIGNSDTVKIVGALVLNDIGDISKYHPYELKVGSGTNLKRLIIGSDKPGYVNDSTQTIEGLSDCALLEEINVRNLTNMRSLNLGGNGLIKKVYAKGSYITTITVPNGGVLEEIEYGARTTNITLLNQSFLTSFIFENTNPSEPNTYPMLTKLWIENCNHPVYNEQNEITGYTCAVPIDEILIKRLGKLTDGIRLVDVNINCGNDTTLLDMLATDELVLGKRLTEKGTLDSNQQLPPHITGNITVTNLRKSIFDKLKTYYPLLTVNVTGQTIPEFTLTYVNVDAQGNETPLITLYRASDQPIPDPVVERDPITGKFYIESAPANQIGNDGTQIVPLRQQDAQFIYRFGTYRNGVYEKYSGWYIKELSTVPTAQTSINMNLTIQAQYPDISRITRTYTITWYDDDNTPLETQNNVPYGFDAGQYSPPGKDNVQYPMIVKKLKNGVYKVFKGWDTPASIVRGNINIHSLWYEFDGNFSNFTDINDLNPAGLYALTQLDVNQRNNLLQNHLAKDIKYITLGHDFEYTDITAYNLLNDENYHYFSNDDNEKVIIYDGTNGNPAIYPLASLRSDFTFAFDFKFILNQTLWNRTFREYVLASCYQNVDGSISGFRIVLSKSNASLPAIRVYWGSNYIDIDNAIIDEANNSYQTFRNMIVLRHNSSESEMNKLYIYSSPQGSSPIYYNIVDTNIQYNEIEWSSSVSVSNPLILGGNLNTSGTIENTQNGLRNATGAVFFAKYWAADLGVDDCSKLARWPHEQIGYRIIGYDNGDTDNNKLIVGDNTTTKINFMAAKALGDRWINYGAERDQAFTGDNNLLLNGWHNSRVREFLQQILYDAFPTAYQSLFNKVVITSIARQDKSTNDTQANPTEFSQSSQDYIYLPAYYEVDNTVPVGSEYRYEVNKPWNHLDIDNIQNVYTLSGGRLVKETSGLSLNYLRFFFQREIPTDARIFHLSSNPYGQQYLVDNVPVTVRAGDIWFDDSNAYIYAGVEDVEKGITTDETKAHGTGEGWSPAVISALRTLNCTAYAGRRKSAHFGKILRNGSVQMVYDSLSGVNNRALLPEFSI